DRPIHYPSPTAGKDQRGVRPDARGQEHSKRDRVLILIQRRVPSVACPAQAFPFIVARSEMTFTRVSSSRCFGGHQNVYQHPSSFLNRSMRFCNYLPRAVATVPLPVLYPLSGMTCTRQNVTTTAGAHRSCEQYGIVLVCADTSP